MSLKVIGYQDGKRIVVDEGRSYARVSGYGGSLVSHAITPIKVHQRNPTPLREKDQRRKERRENPICGALMGWRNQYDSAPIPGLVCFRAPDHKGCHRSAQVMETDRERRRTFRRPGLHKDVA